MAGVFQPRTTHSTLLTLKDAAASFNVKRVEWVVLGWNTPAIKFYEKTGATILKDWYLAQFDQEGLSNFISPNS